MTEPPPVSEPIDPSQVVPPSQEGPPPPNRVTVVETVYFQSPSLAPVTAESRYSYDARDPDLQPYQRTAVVKGQWQPLDLGWLTGQRVGDLVLRHQPPYRATTPTEDQRAEDRSRAIEVGIKVGTDPVSSKSMWDQAEDVIVVFASVGSGRSARFRPPTDPLRPLMVRCVGGERATLQQTAFPE